MRILLLILLSVGIPACVWVEPAEESENELPVIDVQGTGVNLVVGTPHTFDAAKSFDPEGSDLSFLWVVRDPQNEVVSYSDDRISFEPILVGEYEIQIRVSDEDNGNARDTFTIRVTNSDPVPAVRNCVPGARYWNFDVDSLTAMGDIESVCLELDESYDPDGHEIDWDWSINSVPPGGEDARVSGKETMRLFLPVPGSYEGEVILKDAYGGTHVMNLLFVRE